MTLATYARRLAAAVALKDEAALTELCVDLEQEQLGRHTWAPEVFDFFVDALRDPQICDLPGSLSFITSLYGHFDQMEPEQQTTLMRVIDDGADHFGHELLRHAAGDLVARKFPVRAALNTFDRWLQHGTPNRLHMAQVGYEVLAMSGRWPPEEQRRVQALLRRLPGVRAG